MPEASQDIGLLDGLPEKQARRALVPSQMTLLSLVKHAAFAERVWFNVALARRTRAEIGLPKAVDDSLSLTDGDTVESVLAQYRQAWSLLAVLHLAAMPQADRLAARIPTGPCLPGSDQHWRIFL